MSEDHFELVDRVLRWACEMDSTRRRQCIQAHDALVSLTSERDDWKRKYELVQAVNRDWKAWADGKGEGPG